MSESRLVLGLARREAVERARSRGYRISTAMLLLVAVVAVVLPAVLGDEVDRVGVVGDDGAGIAAVLQETAGPDALLEVAAYEQRDAAEAALGEDVDVLLVGREELVWLDEPDDRLASLLTTAVTRLQLRDRAEALGLDDAELGGLLAPVDLATTSLEGDGAEDDRTPQVVVAMAGMVLLFVSITFYGSYILMSVIEEKQNRVVEILLAHIRPRALLAGKVLGHGALGLAQMVAIALVAVVGLAITDPVEVPSTAYGAIAAAVVWFVLGFATYSVLYAALGSLASRTEDAQSAMGPLTVVLLGAYFLAIFTMNDPDGAMMVVGSMLPPTAPLMMPLRTAATDVATWQIGLAVVLQLLAIVGLVRLGGRLYQGAVMHIGPKLSIRDAWHATA